MWMLLLAKPGELFFSGSGVLILSLSMCVRVAGETKTPWASRGFYESLLIFSQNGVYTAAVRARTRMDLGGWSDERKNGLYGLEKMESIEDGKTGLEGYTPRARTDDGGWGFSKGRQIIVDLCFAFAM
ncbi:uncharacterized protein MYCFIDRAFT_210587 [Pseudocercospora fijiensis CIRAD86]|uniref:Uncharacterized protein n=1 Tax=Pseudocercospora fijiensis (strain CIRAD86) TaxID=383855 RepID=M3BC10_PSEFD|nr:uncharacterized protein MYCFIDRAFT_210587 [Pseudocercospora fijiensis CIRAD86]EME86718.1 hypothetical protein MYCFIDRAFT_210587 [Pseudocercospora fijiensis CIRAD86]